MNKKVNHGIVELSGFYSSFNKRLKITFAVIPDSLTLFG
jgi:hypothetical protein